MTRYLLDHDPVSGLYSEFAFDEGDGKYIFNSAQDVSEIIEANKAEMNEAKRTMDGLGRKVASIPLVVWNDLQKKGITRDKAAFKRWLNDQDNKFFKT